MNKDVIYIEPEEDITDVITKIKSSKSKIVALVPPKKSGVFRSIVNIKLIAKAAGNTKKAVVLVTTDPSIVKLAAATQVPVTKDLNTAPAVPELEEEIDETEEVDVEEDASEAEDETKKDAEADEDETEDDETGDEDEEEDDDEEDDDEEDEADEAKAVNKAKSKKAKAADLEDEEEAEASARAKSFRKKSEENDGKKAKKFTNRLASSNNKILKWIGTHPKITAGIGVGCVGLIIFAIWAFAIAPAVTITLSLETTTGNFSESITFTQNLAEEKVSEGKFYIEEKKIESKAEVEFEATGKKNVGEKAKGEVLAVYYFPINSDGGTIPINAGTVFTNGGLNFVVAENAAISWDGDVTAAEKDCENYTKGDNSWKTAGCKVSKKVKVEAAESGAKYNISSSTNGWSTAIAGLSISSSAAMAGGSDKTVTIVQQSDIDGALKKITTENESARKEELIESLNDDQFAIESSFKQTTADPVSSPALGEEVADGKKAKLTVTTTDTIFIIDETKLEEFITEKAKLGDGYKIYDMMSPFIENFTKTDSGYIGKLKTSYIAGSTITENDVVETIKGKGIGTAKRDLTDKFKGIKTITISTSVPWVTSVPGNTEKITVNIEVKE